MVKLPPCFERVKSSPEVEGRVKSMGSERVVMLDTKERRKAYSYARFSSLEQSKGDSLRRQQEAAKKTAEKFNLELVADIEDLGRSAFHGNHIEKGNLGQLLDAIDNDLIPSGSVLLIETFDRLSRQHVNRAAQIFLEIINKDINVITTMDDVEYSSEDGAGKLLQVILKMETAHGESQKKSNRLNEVWTEKKKNAATEKLTAKCPSWLKLRADRKDFDVIEERAAVVRRIYDMALNGYGAMKIAMTLNEEGVPGFGKENNGWHIPYVHKLLAYDAVTGRYVPHSGVGSKRKPCGDPVEDYYPRIITDEIFNAVQQKKAAYRHGAGGRHGHKFTNLFTKLCKCGYCGATMSFYSTTTKKSRYRYIACRDARRGVGCDKYATVEMGAFEKLFFNCLSEIDVAALMSDGTHKTEVQTLKLKLMAVKQQLDDVTKNVETYDKRSNDALLEGEDKLDKFYRDKLKKALSDESKLSDELKSLENQLLVLEHSSKDIAECIEHSLSLYEQIKANPENQDFRLKVNAELRRVIAQIDFCAHKDPDIDDLMPLATIRFKNGAVRSFVAPNEDGEQLHAVEEAPKPFEFEGEDWSGALVYRDPKLGLVPVALYEPDEQGNLVRNK